MDFYDAKTYRLPFGKYKGQQIQKVAESDSGLRYLDWMLGVAHEGRLKEALEVYLMDPTISKDLAEVLEGRENRVQPEHEGRDRRAGGEGAEDRGGEPVPQDQGRDQPPAPSARDASREDPATEEDWY